jgi:Holliday junction resolvasome RuvABC endonuclease subunit
VTTAVLALDLSLAATGAATPHGDLSTIRPTTRGDIRLHEIKRRCYDLVVELGASMVVIEDLPTGLRNAAAGSLGMLHGAIRAMLIGVGIPYLTVPPATLKTYATGRGNAPKPDLRMELYKRTGIDVPDDNQVDAAWLRLLALDLLGEPGLTLPQTHRRALAKLSLPAVAVVP